MLKPIKRFLKLRRKSRSFGRSVVPDFFGHARTIKEQVLDDDEGLPLPWMTYPAICYLKQIDFSSKSVFEYGAGSSTRFWSSRAKRIVSVEHNPEWTTKIRSWALPNVELIHAVGEAYVAAVERTAPHDVIVIDGRWRYDCAMRCLHALSRTGMVILDNSERYPAITEHFRSSGLIQIDFIGVGPINLTLWTASIFLTRTIKLKPFRPVQPYHLPGMSDSIEVKPEMAEVNRPGSF